MQSFVMHKKIIFVAAVLLFVMCAHARAATIVDKTIPSNEDNNPSEQKSKVYESRNGECTSDSTCHEHSRCRNGMCVCDKGWLTWHGSQRCAYEQKSKMIALVVSVLLGGLGVDWFVLARGSGVYVLTGLLKLFVCGGCCICIPRAFATKKEGCQAVAICCTLIIIIAPSIWWIVDWVRILADQFPDGHGASLVSW